MKLPNINGNVSTKGYENWVELNDVQFAAQRKISQNVGRPTDRETGAPRLSEVSVTKSPDKSSPLLLEALLKGKALEQVTIAVCRNGSDPKLTAQYTLHDVMLSHYEERINSASEHADEYLSLSYSKIEKRYVPYNSQGTAGAAISSGYDLVQAKVV
jgi:type VI secretion system secreted protein Hcp